jgi:hypothetical protein
VATLRRRVTASQLPEEQCFLVREALIKRGWRFRSITVAFGALGAGGGELVAVAPAGAALGALAGLALPLIFEEPLIARLCQRRERRLRAKMALAEAQDGGVGGDAPSPHTSNSRRAGDARPPGGALGPPSSHRTAGGDARATGDGMSDLPSRPSG